MVVEQRIKTKIPYKYESTPRVFEIGGKILTVAGTMYYICASTKEVLEDVPYFPPLFRPAIEDTVEIWGSGARYLYSPERKSPIRYRELVRVEESTYATIESDFYRLAQQWERERPHGADVSGMVMHPSYQRIIGMGPDVVPLLLKELERKPGHWFWALYAITGVDPVLPENQGNLKEMAKAWIDWGKKQGYSW